MTATPPARAETGSPDAATHGRQGAVPPGRISRPCPRGAERPDKAQQRYDNRPETRCRAPMIRGPSTSGGDRCSDGPYSCMAAPVKTAAAAGAQSPARVVPGAPAHPGHPRIKPLMKVPCQRIARRDARRRHESRPAMSERNRPRGTGRAQSRPRPGFQVPPRRGNGRVESAQRTSRSTSTGTRVPRIAAPMLPTIGRSVVPAPPPVPGRGTQSLRLHRGRGLVREEEGKV